MPAITSFHRRGRSVPVKMLPPLNPEWPAHLPPIGVKIPDDEPESWRIEAGRKAGKVSAGRRFDLAILLDLGESLPVGFVLPHEERRRLYLARKRKAGGRASGWSKIFRPLPTQKTTLEPARP